ncbi:major facilitator superfamily domain-containing protein 8-like [Hydractinia symbiolongicarpus]|uniref:major facilitator superfamily domain-containing protein 8-like n=1 Tax=Hydractinia symbiolongicarpus TaxID=13093 RepID=UPI0025518CBE|nr:major facilitator superfamily domain-containing protein 8-like [Hydractinia symbiolongicarpus]
MPIQTTVTIDSYFFEVENDPKFCRKRKHQVIMFMLRAFLAGAAYSIFLPSIWFYLDTYDDVESWFLGFVVAVYSIASMVSLPFVGMFFDKTKRIKEIVLVLNGFEIIGSIVYALPYSKWLVFFGRMIAGFGDGFFACANTAVVHMYPVRSRTGIFSLLQIGWFLGFICGPLFYFFLTMFASKLNNQCIIFGILPGAGIALLWILFEFGTIFYICNLSKHTEINHGESSICQIPPASQERMSFDETLYQRTESDVSQTKYNDCDVAKPESIKELITQHCSIELLSLFFSELAFWSTVTQFLVLLPLITESDSKWDKYIGIIFVLGVVLLMFVFLLIYKFSNKTNVKDQLYVLISLLLTILSLILLMCEQIPKEKDLKSRFSILLSACILIFSAISLNLSAVRSLATKLTPRSMQGFTQGVLSCVSRVALSLGPILAGLSLDHRLKLSITNIVLCVVAFIWIVLCLKRIKRKSNLMQEIDS